MANSDAAIRAELKRRLEQAGYGVVSVRQHRGSIYRAFLAFSPDSCPRNANVIEWSAGSDRASRVDGTNDGYVDSMEVPALLPITDGCSVKLTTGTVLKDVRRTTKTGKKWTGTLVRVPRFPVSADPTYVPGMPSMFHESALRCVITAEQLAEIETPAAE
jgi:hypothetical protein